MDSVFNTDKRIKMGIWGLGRGQSFLNSAKALNIDVVAGCDIHPEMRARFQQNVPDAFLTDKEDEFLAQDFDVVLIATYLKDHAKHTIKALEAGKHVLCEVTSFYTVAEGVQVIEAVEKSGKIYNLLENYPFTKPNLYLKKLWDDGMFGEFQYAEFEYAHEARILLYAYNTPGESLPVEPGYTVHNWRAGLNYHYYCTHSLGPIMQITGRRPVKVSAFPCDIHLPGMLQDIPRQSFCPSMIQMDNGGLVRNLMASSTNDYHFGERLWGTLAGAEKITDDLRIRVGGAGGGHMLDIQPEWPELGELASSTGHGGGDFWELYYFARQFFTGEPAPWDIYSAADVTLAGIMAVESASKGGIPLEIPDLRDPAVRDRYRNHPAAP
ncbi:MAG: Gfo/Idh/MocA family oxidoreductase, partial [Lentisphaeria bacterium]|nr:Gfo/Idh/MocA family oxidoreductase [Lentisphaeria bacterium]